MEILTFELGPVATNAYLVLPPGTDEAFLVDAPPDVLEAISPELKARKRRLTTLLLTHGHWDHIVGAVECRAAGAVVYAHTGDRTWIENPAMQTPFAVPGMRMEPVHVDHWLKHGQTFDVCGLQFEVRHVPGHAPGSIMFYSAKFGCAFVGDLIMAGSVGRPDLPGGDWPTLENSIRKQVYTLPGETVLYPGHGPATTVATESAENSFVRG